eukprot:7101186-Prymnesium_polylepis.1
MPPGCCERCRECANITGVAPFLDSWPGFGDPWRALAPRCGGPVMCGVRFESVLSVSREEFPVRVRLCCPPARTIAGSDAGWGTREARRWGEISSSIVLRLESQRRRPHTVSALSRE